MKPLSLITIYAGILLIVFACVYELAAICIALRLGPVGIMAVLLSIYLALAGLVIWDLRRVK